MGLRRAGARLCPKPRVTMGLRRAGARLPRSQTRAGARAYQRLVPQAGRFASEVLGLDLAVLGAKLRFFAGNALVEESAERIAHLGGMLDEVIAHKEEAERQAEEAIGAANAAAEAARLELVGRLDEEQRRREEAERLLGEARAEIERLKRGD